jgi:hypothetical protein
LQHLQLAVVTLSCCPQLHTHTRACACPWHSQVAHAALLPCAQASEFLLCSHGNQPVLLLLLLQLLLLLKHSSKSGI